MSFIFDKFVRDHDHNVRVDVTVVDADKYSNVQVNLKSGVLRIPFFLTFESARTLAKYLLQACDAYDAAVAKDAAAPAGWESIETTTE